MTIFARKVDTGEAVWAYQMTPFDQWDYDGVNENILIDMEIDGKKVKALTHFDRNGFAYVLDRTDGTLLRANKFVTTDWAEKVDLKTGRPVKVREHSPLELGRNTSACPSAMGGKDQQPCSVDPRIRPSSTAPPTTGAWSLSRRSARTRSRARSTCSRTCTCSLRSRHDGQAEEVRRAHRQGGLGNPRSVSELGRQHGDRRRPGVLRLARR